MRSRPEYSGLSDLERELELEMDEELEGDEEADEEFEGAESEGDDRERAIELNEGSEVDELELEGESDVEEVGASDAESGYAEGDREREFVERFMEVAAREFESEAEVDQAMNETLSDVASEYLFGSIWKKAKRFGGKLAKNRIIRGLVKKGMSVASGQFPALKAALQLAKGDLQGALLNLGKQALGTAIPGGGAALGAIKAIGFETSEDPAANRRGWENYVRLSREAFEHLADNVNESADHPIVANRLAANAFQHAVKRAQARVARSGTQRASQGNNGRPGRVVRYRLRSGERIVITGGHTLIVKGA